MAKSMLPMKGGSGLLPKMIVGLVTLAVLALVVRYPADAASFTDTAFGFAANAIDGMAVFLRNVLA